MSKKRKAGVAIVVITAVFAAVLLYTAPDMGQASAGRASKGQAMETLPVTGVKSPVVYTVQKGDCLWSVAEKFDIDVDLLAYANDMDAEDFLLENSEIVIPDGNKITYTVAPGDTLWNLAKTFNTTIEEMVKENGNDILENLKADLEITVPVATEYFDTGELKSKEPEGNNSDGIDSEKVSGINIPQLNNWPVQGTVSSVFGKRWGRMHKGIDIAAEHGRSVRTLEDGIVVFSGDRGSYGKTVIIDHGNGFRSLYAHASELTVDAGERVNKGQIIARIGSTGRSTGPHLHLELLYKGKPVDPEKFLPDKI